MTKTKTNECIPLFLSEGQLRAELEKCEYCAEKPCKEACPVDCSPADFIMAVRVGAPSEAELKSLKEAFDDAINATKAAIAEGIVPGGGLALLRTICAVEKEEQTAEGDEKT